MNTTESELIQYLYLEGTKYILQTQLSNGVKHICIC
jgi:hypothetical protein